MVQSIGNLFRFRKVISHDCELDTAESRHLSSDSYNSTRNRDKTIDVLRGLGIIFIVAGHSSVGTGLVPFPPYSFHIPLFFFLSGYFFKEKFISKSDFLKIIKTLLIPLLFLTIFYALLGNFFASFGFNFLGSEISFKKIFISPFLLSNAFPFCYAYWFVGCLIILRLYFQTIHIYISRMFKINGKYKSIIFLIIYFIISLMSVFYSLGIYKSQGQVSVDQIFWLRLLFASFFYYFGYL
ncbi:MAG: acyltransferase family protein, partial [bacterium]